MEEASAPGNGAVFATTRWSVVTRAAADSPEAAGALAQLCEAYWYPLYAYVRRRGYSSEDAQDLTQEFFAKFLRHHRIEFADRARGRFRTFLLTSISNHLHSEWDRARALKRGGGALVFSIDVDEAEDRYRAEPAEVATPESLFEKRWALLLLDRVMQRLQLEFEQTSRPELFAALRPHLWGHEPPTPYEQLASRLGASAESLRVAVHRLRRRYREILREEIAQTVADPSDIEDEIRHLIRAVGQS